MKYSAFTILTLIAAVLAAAWYWSDGPVRQIPGAYNVSELAQLTQRITIPSTDQNQLEQAGRQLQGLSSSIFASDESVATAQLIEPRPAPARPLPPAIVPAVTEQRETGDNEVVAESIPLPGYNVSMIFVGPTARYAVVDGLFRTEGDFMPDGSRVEQISEQGVQLRISNGTSHLYRVTQ